jgi:hypothetical protein
MEHVNGGMLMTSHRLVDVTSGGLCGFDCAQIFSATNTTDDDRRFNACSKLPHDGERLPHSDTTRC